MAVSAGFTASVPAILAGNTYFLAQWPAIRSWTAIDREM